MVALAYNACGFVQAVPTARIFRLVELDMKLIDIRQTGLAQNRLLYVVFFCAADHFVKLYPDKKYEKVKL